MQPEANVDKRQWDFNDPRGDLRMMFWRLEKFNYPFECDGHNFNVVCCALPARSDICRQNTSHGQCAMVVLGSVHRVQGRKQ